MTRQGENSKHARRAPPPAPPTRAEYDGAKPFHKGFMAYQFGGRPGSQVPGLELCPFMPGSKDREAYEAGVRRAEHDAERDADV